MDARTLVNGSFLSNDEVKRLVMESLARAHEEVGEKTYIIVSNGRSGRRIRGYMHSLESLPAGFILPPGKAFFVSIEVGPYLPYPHVETYRKRAGEASWGNWQEEFSHVLDHELCHVMQGLGVDGFGDHPHVEVEAEQYALAGR